MSRSGYVDDCDDNLQMGRWRGQVASATRGKRGQAFFKEALQALDAMPVKRLIAKELLKGGEFCTLGVVGNARGIEMKDIDPDCYEGLSNMFGIAHQLIQEVEYYNDECGPWDGETPEQRWIRMRAWVANQIAVKP